MKPGTSGENLLYVTSYGGDGGVVDVFIYPQGEQVGTITGLIAPPGACVDAAGNVFITDLAPGSMKSGVIYEYAHGGTTPIATLSDPAIAYGCAINPTTGDLAVSGWSDSDDRGAVAIYTDAQGTPKMYYAPKSVGFLYCAYDSQGNLYISEGLPDGEGSSLARLAHGSNRVDQLKVNKSIRGFPSVLWDGEHVVASSVRRFADGKVLLYRLAFSGKNARVIGTTTLKNGPSYLEGQIWFFSGTVFMSMFRNYYSHIAWWQYPQGGKPSGISRRAFPESSTALGLTLSPAQSR